MNLDGGPPKTFGVLYPPQVMFYCIFKKEFSNIIRTFHAHNLAVKIPRGPIFCNANPLQDLKHLPILFSDVQKGKEGDYSNPGFRGCAL